MEPSLALTAGRRQKDLPNPLAGLGWCIFKYADDKRAAVNKVMRLNPSESFSIANRKKVRQHVRHQAVVEAKEARKNKAKRPKQAEVPEADASDCEELLFKDGSHPSYIATPHLFTSLRQQVHKNNKKRLIGQGDIQKDVDKLEQSTEIPNSTSMPEGREALARLFALGISPAISHISQASCIYPIKMTHDCHEAVSFIHSAFALTKISVTDLPIWFRLFLLDPAAFLMVLQCTIFRKDLSQGISHTQKRNERLALTYSRHAILSVQKRLVNSEDSQSIGVVIAIISFMVQCSSFGRKEEYITHKNGLAYIISQRGGITTLNDVPGLRVVLMWNEVVASYSFGYPPLFPFPAHELPAMPSCQPHQPTSIFSATLKAWRILYATIESASQDFTEIMISFHDLNAVMRTRQKDLQDVHRDMLLGLNMNSIVMDLLSPIAISSVWGQGCSVEKACRLAALLYLGNLRHVLNETYYPSGDQFLNELKHILLVPNSEWESLIELRLWIFVVGGMRSVGSSVGGNDSNMFADGIRDIMNRLELYTWEDVEGIVLDFVWIEPLFKTRLEWLRETVG